MYTIVNPEFVRQKRGSGLARLQGNDSILAACNQLEKAYCMCLDT